LGLRASFVSATSPARAHFFAALFTPRLAGYPFIGRFTIGLCKSTACSGTEPPELPRCDADRGRLLKCASALVAVAEQFDAGASNGSTDTASSRACARAVALYAPAVTRLLPSRELLIALHAALRLHHGDARVVIVPLDPRNFRAPDSTYRIPPPDGSVVGTVLALAMNATPLPPPRDAAPPIATEALNVSV